MMQAMPSRYDLEQARKQNEWVVAGYEVLLSHYREQLNEVQTEMSDSRRDSGQLESTDLQEAIGDL